MNLEAHASTYYRAALVGLVYLEQQRPTGRRFGVDADLRWKGFAGHLTTADRLDLLVRDADAQWPGSMGARRIFRLHGVAEDDAFGAEWGGLEPVRAEELWREVTRAAAPSGLRAALDAMAGTLGITLSRFDVAQIGALDPSRRIVVAGPSAIAALAESFVGKPGLDWADQVVCIATSPAARQIAMFCAAALDSAQMGVVLAAGEPHTDGRFGVGAHVLSDDAAPEDREWALRVMGG